MTREERSTLSQSHHGIMKIFVIAQSGGGLPAFLRAVPRISVTEKLQLASFRSVHKGLSPFSPTFSRTKKSRTQETANKREKAMRDGFDYEIPDTTACKEWLGVVGSMMAAVAICAVLFAGGILTY